MKSNIRRVLASVIGGVALVAVLGGCCGFGPFGPGGGHGGGGHGGGGHGGGPRHHMQQPGG